MLLAFGAGLLVTGSAGYMIGRGKSRRLDHTVQCILWGIIGSLLAYNYFALGLPGTAWLNEIGGLAGLISTLIGGVAGLALYRVYARQRRQEH